jgi:hypothetical protein
LVARDLAGVPASTRAKVVRENVAKLYDFPIPTHVRTAVTATDGCPGDGTDP